VTCGKIRTRKYLVVKSRAHEECAHKCVVVHTPNPCGCGCPCPIANGAPDGTGVAAPHPAALPPAPAPRAARRLIPLDD
jgi:hypothetical protein